LFKFDPKVFIIILIIN